MAWTQAKTAIVIGAGVLLAAGTTTIAVRHTAHYREDSVWGHITAVDKRQLNAAPEAVSIRPTKFGPEKCGGIGGGDDRQLFLCMDVVTLISSAYEVNAPRIVDSAALPKDRYDWIVSLPSNQSEALQAEIKKKLGLVAKGEMRETNVLLLTVARQNAPGLKPTSVTDGTSSSLRPVAGRINCTNQPVSTLASLFLENILEIPVIDQTDLTGRYDFDLHWSQPGGYAAPNPEALKQALLDQLGLKLTPATKSIEMLVVEKAQ